MKRVFAVALFLMFSAPAAFANSPIPAAAVFLTPIWLSVPGLSAVLSALIMLAGVVAIEMAVLALFFRRPWPEALRLAGQANLVTTLIGLIFGAAQGFTLIALIATIVYAYKLMRQTLHCRPVILAPVLVTFGMMTIGIIILIPSTLPGMVLQFYATMLYAILLTVIFEAAFYARRVGGVRRGAVWSLAANGVSYGMILAGMLLTGFRSGPLVASEFLKYRIVVQARRGASVTETTRKLEELYLWQDSKTRAPAPPVRDDVWFELRLVREWADAGRLADARSLYQMIAAYRSRPAAASGSSEDYMAIAWDETAAALHPAARPRAR